MRAVFPFESSELFSKPQMNLQPADVFEGERFELECSSVVHAKERIGINALQYSIYMGNYRVARTRTFSDRARLSRNGNYTCKVQVSTATRSFVKESRTVVLEVKGEAGETLGFLVTRWCFSFGNRKTHWCRSLHYKIGISQCTSTLAQC